MLPEENEFDPFQIVEKRIKAVGFDNLNEYEKAYYAVWWFCAETTNGGLHTLFFNSTGGMIPEMRMGLKMIGAAETLCTPNCVPAASKAS